MHCIQLHHVYINYAYSPLGPVRTGLTYYEYPFSPVGTCAGPGTALRSQALDCTNQGTLFEPDYQSVVCVDVELPPP